MVARRPVPDQHHVMRFISPTKRFVDPDAVRQGPSFAGFKLGEKDDGGLSVTEIEVFGEMSADARRNAAAAHRGATESKRLSKEGIFAWAKVADVRSAAVTYGKPVRVVHDPVPGNPGHAEVRQFSDDDNDLLDHLARNVFVQWELVGAMNLP